MILADSSVWVDHLRRRHAGLVARLDEGDIGCHPFVIGEVGLGSLAHRAEILSLMAALPAARVVRHEEAVALVARERLHGAGIGWVDVHLLASALVERWSRWTLDRRLAVVARDLSVAWDGGR